MAFGLFTREFVTERNLIRPLELFICDLRTIFLASRVDARRSQNWWRQPPGQVNVVGMKLVINADDLGYNQERDRGIFECFEDGVVTSTSVLANGFYGEKALRQAVKIGLPAGLHFNITEGRPLSAPSKLPSLTRNGLFHGKLGFFDAVKKNAIDGEDVMIELEAQLQWFRRISGELPVRVDGHQHCHVMPPVRESFCQTLKQHGIKWTRLPLEDTNVDKYVSFLEYVSSSSSDCKEVFSAHGLQHTDSFIGLCTTGSQMSIGRLETLLSLASSRGDTGTTCELMVHPGYSCTGEGGCGVGPDDFSKSYDRQHEMAVLRSTEFRKVLEKNSIHVSSFEDLKQVQ